VKKEQQCGKRVYGIPCHILLHVLKYLLDSGQPINVSHKFITQICFAFVRSRDFILGIR